MIELSCDSKLFQWIEGLVFFGRKEDKRIHAGTICEENHSPQDDGRNMEQEPGCDDNCSRNKCDHKNQHLIDAEEHSLECVVQVRIKEKDDEQEAAHQHVPRSCSEIPQRKNAPLLGEKDGQDR